MLNGAEALVRACASPRRFCRGSPDGDSVASSRVGGRKLPPMTRVSVAVANRQRGDEECPSPRPNTRASEAELGPEQVVDRSAELALPPDDFMTWPTNQPSDCGLSLTCAALSGLARDDVVDHLLDRREIGDLLHAAAFDQRAGIAAFPAGRSRTDPWRSCRRSCPRRSGR